LSKPTTALHLVVLILFQVLSVVGKCEAVARREKRSKRHNRYLDGHFDWRLWRWASV
jgi:hypothetical protein